MKLLTRIKNFFLGSKFYNCPRCGWQMPKQEATISGWDSEQSSLHIHCQNCGKIIQNI